MWELYTANKYRLRRKEKTSERARVAAASTIEEVLEIMTPDSVGVIPPEAMTTDEDSETDDETWLRITPEAEQRIQQELDRKDQAETDTPAEWERARTTRTAEKTPQATKGHIAHVVLF